jgi:hypothetical protein
MVGFRVDPKNVDSYRSVILADHSCCSGSQEARETMFIAIEVRRKSPTI